MSHGMDYDDYYAMYYYQDTQRDEQSRNLHTQDVQMHPGATSTFMADVSATHQTMSTMPPQTMIADQSIKAKQQED